MRNRLLRWAIFAGTVLVGASAFPLDTEPSKTKNEQHPLDPVLKLAQDGLKHLDAKVRDYVCIIVKRERVNGELGEMQFIAAKVRHEQKQNGQDVPFSVYLKFLQPKAVAGREVIWISGRNDNKLVAHETGLLNFKRAWLDPNGFLAMMGQRYPISEIGMRNLIEELITKGERQRQLPDCEVKIRDDAKIDDHPCRLIQVVHPQKRPEYEFYKVHIFIDREQNIPIRYACWTWPAKPGDDPVLEEEYTYTNVKLNVGLTDKDFDPDNSDYNFPAL